MKKFKNVSLLSLRSNLKLWGLAYVETKKGNRLYHVKTFEGWLELVAYFRSLPVTNRTVISLVRCGGKTDCVIILGEKKVKSGRVK